MEISNTTYYQNLISPLKTQKLQTHIAFCTDGFSYTSNIMAFVLTRLSKNNYEILAIYNGHYEKYNYDSINDAVHAAIDFINTDPTI